MGGSTKPVTTATEWLTALLDDPGSAAQVSVARLPYTQELPGEAFECRYRQWTILIADHQYLGGGGFHRWYSIDVIGRDGTGVVIQSYEVEPGPIRALMNRVAALDRKHLHDERTALATEFALATARRAKGTELA